MFHCTALCVAPLERSILDAQLRQFARLCLRLRWSTIRLMLSVPRMPGQQASQEIKKNADPRH